MIKPTKLAVYGAAGRMGQRIVAIAETNPYFEVVATIDRNLSQGQVDDCDVVIDFSLPAATDGLLSLLAKIPAGVVTGVTGRTPEEADRVFAEAKRRPVFAAANFSLGVAVLNQLVQQAVAALGSEFDAEVFEIHHRMKEDAPSGTALRLAQTAAEASGLAWPDVRKNRDGRTGPRGEHEVGTAALRGGTVAGEHTVFLFGQSERLELTHRATDRDVFVHGALRAARWLTSQSPGRYEISDLIKPST